MLTKLIRYDFRSTGRAFGPMYLVVLVLSVLYAVFSCVPRVSFIPLKVLFEIILVLYTLALIALFLLTMVFCIKYFYDNLFRDEGYLMHTLPVTPAQLLWSKIITGGVWTLASCVVAYGSLYISNLLQTRRSDFLQSIWHTLSQTEQHPDYIWAILLALLDLIAGLIFAELIFYTSMSVGSLVQKHHRMVSIFVLIGFMVVHTIIITIIYELCSTSPFRAFIENNLRINVNAVQGADVLLGGILAYFVVFNIINFAITNVIMKKHLNLQ
ncbi:MAG: hypothetical protein PHU79_03475 [Oscillospiraceae bacterium]|nr:hypothetical protein [Oscillospiraceae bacterium]